MWIDLARLTPDMIVAAVVFTASGLALRLRVANASTEFIALGAVVALGYLAKAVMFPLGLLFLTLAAWTPGNRTLGLKRIGLGVAGFIVVSSPQIVSVSRLVGHPTYAETGTAAYAREVNKYPTRWVGEPAGSGKPIHPVTRLSVRPDAFTYAVADTRSSFPLWDKPAYWVAGIIPHFDSARQLAVAVPILWTYLDATLLVLFVILILLFLQDWRPSVVYVPLVLTGLAAFVVYALVFAELRYLAPWLIVAFFGIVCAMRFPIGLSRSVHAILAALALCEGIPLIRAAWHEMRTLDIQTIGEPSSNVALQIGIRLHSMGIAPGDRVAVVGYAFDGYWARLGGIQIAGDVPDFQQYWLAGDSAQTAIDEKFRQAGMVAIVANRVPKAWSGAGWNTVGLGSLYIKPLAKLRE
jgi:hypothetical protein